MTYYHCSLSKYFFISYDPTRSTFPKALEITIISTLLRLIFYYIVSFKELNANFLASSNDIF